MEDVPLANVIETGLEFEHLPGCVPTFLEVQACHAANYQYFTTWQKLSADQQAFLIAHFVADRWINSHRSDAEYRAASKK